MREALLLSIRLHGLWIFEAFDVRGRYLAPLSSKRLVFLLILYPFFLLIQGIHWLGFLLDELIFRSYRDVIIKEPLIITGIPKSGATCIHKTLSRASHQFTTFQTWEALLAPSITERQVIRWLAEFDKRFESRPMHKLVERLISNFAHIYDLDLRAPAEDYQSLLPIGSCFLMVLAFPGSRSLWQLGRFQEMPEDQRRTIVDFHKACLKRHLYWVGQDRRLLSANEAFGSWLPDLRFAYPDARYLFCIREPGPALAAQLSAIKPGLECFGTMNAADTYSLELQTVFAHVYRIILKEKQSFFVDHLAIVDHSDLKTDSKGELRRALKQLCVTIDRELDRIIVDIEEEILKAEKTDQNQPLGAKSGPDEFNSLVGSIYREILEHPYMTPRDLR